MKTPINSTKHYVQQSLATVVGSSTTIVNVATSVNAPSANLANEVREGAVIKAIYLEMWVRSTELSPGTVLVSFMKRPGSSVSPTFANMVSMFDYANKKNIFYHTQGLTNENSADAIPFIRMWVKIPKGKQRMGLGDRFDLVITSQAAIDNVICGFFTYKEYY